MKLSTVIFYTIGWSMCAISINTYDWYWSESEGKRPKPTTSPQMRLWLTYGFPEIHQANISKTAARNKNDKGKRCAFDSKKPFP